jgi:hypothetical protein
MVVAVAKSREVTLVTVANGLALDGRGAVEEWRSGGVEEWRSGGVEEWRSGGVEEWRSGGVEEWRSGGCAARVSGRGLTSCWCSKPNGEAC